MNTGERKALAEDIADEVAAATRPRRRVTDMSKTYQWVIGVLLSIVITSIGGYVGNIIRTNEREHQRMEKKLNDLEFWVYEMR